MGQEILVLKGEGIDSDDALEAAVAGARAQGFSVDVAFRVHGGASTLLPDSGGPSAEVDVDVDPED